MPVEITNLSGRKIDILTLKRNAKKAWRLLKSKNSRDLSIVLVRSQKIKEINRQFRHQKRPTDVLSFENLNEIFICPQMVQNQAKLPESELKSELTRLIIHGILHLAGYDHEKNKIDAEKMKKLENKILLALI